MGCCQSDEADQFDYDAELMRDQKNYSVAVEFPDDEKDLIENAGPPRRLAGMEGKPLVDKITFDDGKTAESLWECFTHGLETSPNAQCLGTRQFTGPNNAQTGQYVHQTYADVDQYVREVASGLLALGLEAGDTVGICSANRAEWVITALACYSQKLVVVSLYDTLGADAVEYILNHAECKVALFSHAKLPILLKCINKIEKLQHCVMFDHNELYGNSNEVVSDDDVKTASESNVELIGFNALRNKGMGDAAKFPSPPSRDDLAMIMYTSGTTGTPKGVLLSHGNIAACCGGIFMTVPDLSKSKHVHLSYLPLAHIFETVVISVILCMGGTVSFFGGNIKRLKDDICEVRPTIFAGVPRVYARFYDKVMAAIGAMNCVKQPIVMSHYKKQARASRVGPLANDDGVMQKVRATLGLDRARVLVTGAAPMPPYVMEFLRAVVNPDVGVLQGYGMTETGAAVTTTRSGDHTMGHVGPPLASAEVRLQSVPEMNYLITDNPPRGEVLARGPSIFRGYFKNEEATNSTLEHGWIHTGDVGRWNPNGTLSIIDRKKNIFKLAQGEYIASEKIEGVLKRSATVSQVWVYGNSYKPFIVAVVVPDGEYWWNHAKKQGWWPAGDESGLATAEWCPVFKKVIDEHIDEVRDTIYADLKKMSTNAKLHSFEMPRGIIVESEVDEMLTGFNVANECLTSTFKLRRPFLLKRYNAAIRQLYTDLGEAPKPDEKW
eukprot:TRINITY_DN64771_c0_g2_i1.p1 TRINITY_DN64771_c0_g2~~TRINITY_DN64771_c0_g2_i1.p1  ORF type:complete len:721 (-),score=443.10 TRINITY_DN64771_c0_g2_i1:559-2721(-)